ncbi:uncharacterized protein LOC117179892 [Belonocnema kinseyi]|uniref:uncharacterized protein LOC117179892 n=1 Tax=Belonocnema kinseyi TaxID=2817044 RepID=UPI00143D199A|nr:uncharacterized protein LOC117179892 [Belonocnema kinseyi]
MAKKVNKKKVFRSPKPIKIAALVVSAIQDLKDSKGSTPKKITGYITYASQLPTTKVRRRVNAALKQGVQYGILRRYRGHYFLPFGDELDRANKIATRFARLASSNRNGPLPDMAKIAPEKEITLKIKGKKVRRANRTKRLRKPARRGANKKKRMKAHSVPVSTSPSLNNKLKSIDDENSVESDN